MKKLRSRDYKAMARKRLIGRYGTVIGASFLTALIVMIPAMAAYMMFLMSVIGIRTGVYSPDALTGAGGAAVAVAVAFLAIVAVILLLIFVMGEYRIGLNIAREEPCSIKDLFFGFKRGSRPGRFVVSYIFLTVIGLAVTELINFASDRAYYAGISVLFIIAGIVLAYFIYYYVMFGFAFVCYIRIEEPETGIIAAFKESLKLMKKRRLRFLLISLSFIPWVIPIYMSLGIAVFWIAPYMMLTSILFYIDARGELIKEDKEEEVITDEMSVL